MDPAVIFVTLALLTPLAAVAALVYAVSRWRRAGAATESGEPATVLVRRIYFYLVALAGLLVGAGGLVFIAQFALEALFGQIVLADSRDPLAIGLSLALVGLAVWGLHWRAIQRSLSQSPAEQTALLRSIYIYLLLAIAGAFLLAAGYQVLDWLLSLGRGNGFEPEPWALALVWGPVWAYHWWIGSAAADDPNVGVRRLYIYGAAAVALAVGATGAGMAIFAVLREGYHAFFGAPALSGGGLWGETMVSGLALALAGGPAWWIHFRRFGAGQSDSVLRQVYLFAATHIGGQLLALIAAIAAAVLACTWLIGDPSNDGAAEHFVSMPNWIALLAVGIAIWAYHRAVLLGEADRSPPGMASSLRVSTYVSAGFGLAVLATAVGMAASNLATTLFEPAADVLSGAGLRRNAAAVAIALAAVGTPVWAGYWRAAQARVGADEERERSALARRIFVFMVLGAMALVLIGGLSFLLYALLSDWLAGEFGLEFLYEGRNALGAIAASLPFLLYYWRVHQQDRALEPARPKKIKARRQVAVLAGPGGESFVVELERVLGYRVEVFRWVDSAGRAPEPDPEQVEAVAAGIAAAAGERVLITLDAGGPRILSYEP